MSELAPAEIPKGIDAARVTEWYAANVKGAKPPLTFSIIASGHSNLTYRVTDAAGNRTVLRRPPLGAVLATAHDMGREHKIIAASAQDGRARRAGARPVRRRERERRAVLRDEVRARASCSTDRPRSCALFVPERERSELGESRDRCAGAACTASTPTRSASAISAARRAYLPRQLNRWRTQWEKSKTRELPAMEEVDDGARVARCRRRAHRHRARRLPAREHASPARTRASRRCSTGSCARSATRSPTSAT